MDDCVKLNQIETLAHALITKARGQAEEKRATGGKVPAKNNKA